MLIDKMHLKFFRNHTDFDIKFSPGINVIWGKNGVGKTSILEAVYILSIGKSFKTNRVNEIINNKSKSLSIDGFFYNTENDLRISFHQFLGKSKMFKINGVKEVSKNIIGRFPVVLLSPEEEKTTKGQPSDRRKFFDKLFSLLSKDYLFELIKYNSILKNRNNLLRMNYNYEAILPWDIQLSRYGVSLWKKKQTYNQIFSDILINVSNKYNNNTVISFTTNSQNLDEEEFTDILKKSFQKDLITKRTNFGPHRDVYNFLLNDKDLKVFGSQGEHKLAFSLIKFSEYQTIKQETKKSPTILLDDLFARLDSDRSANILRLLEDNTQTIITNTDLTDIKNRGINTNLPSNKDFYLEKIWKN